MSKALSYTEIFELLCKSTNKWGLSLSFDWVWLEPTVDDVLSEIEKATNGRLVMYNDTQCIMDGYAVFLFDSEDEMLEAYEDIVGDDGPTARNSYDGPVRIYALTCSNEGVTLNENT